MEARCAAPAIVGRGGGGVVPAATTTTTNKFLVGGGGGGNRVGGGFRDRHHHHHRRHHRHHRQDPRGRGTTRTMALPPNKEWPPADVWEDFRKAVTGEWEGHAVTCDPRGDVVPLPSNYVPDAFREYGVGVNQWATRSTTRGDEPGGITDVESFATQTRYLYPEAGCDFGREDVAKTRDDPNLLGEGGQMGKMFVVDGDYCDGPLLLPPCEPGSRARFEFGFSTRVTQDSEDDDDDGVKGPIKLDLGDKDKNKDKVKDETKSYRVPPRRFRVSVVVEAAPESKRKWRAAEIEIINESRVVDGGGGGGGDGDAIEPAPEPEKGVKLGEDDIATGNWRAVSGLSLIHI